MPDHHDLDHEAEDAPEVADGPFDLEPVQHPDLWIDGPEAL